jgi:hypothetical protein
MGRTRELRVNCGKRLAVEVGGRAYARIPIKTHVITAADDIVDVVQRYAGPLLHSEDMLVISEKVVSIAQQRAYPISQIKPSWLARVLAEFVYKSPYGIGLGSPWTMELAIREAGPLRVVAAAAVAGVAKVFGARGVFYRVCGADVAAIDGPCDYTLPPYNRYAILGPSKPNDVAQSISEATGVPVAVVDANDLGVAVLGVSAGCPERAFLAEALADNPLGQSCEQTPIGIVRPARYVPVRGGAVTLRRSSGSWRRC